MKTKLLRKIRSRIVSVKFQRVSVLIKYYDSNNEVLCHSVRVKQDLLTIIRCMFGDLFANVVEHRNNKANFRRVKKMKQPIKYTWDKSKIW